MKGRPTPTPGGGSRSRSARGRRRRGSRGRCAGVAAMWSERSAWSIIWMRSPPCDRPHERPYRSARAPASSHGSMLCYGGLTELRSWKAHRRCAPLGPDAGSIRLLLATMLPYHTIPRIERGERAVRIRIRILRATGGASAKHAGPRLVPARQRCRRVHAHAGRLRAGVIASRHGLRDLGCASRARPSWRRYARRALLRARPAARDRARRDRRRRDRQRRRAQPGAGSLWLGCARPTRSSRRSQQDGTCWMGGTHRRGRRYMRIAVSNWSTHGGRRRSLGRRDCGDCGQHSSVTCAMVVCWPRVA